MTATTASSSSSDSRAPIRIGVIGAESRGVIARRAHLPECNSVLVAACTLQPERIVHMKNEFGADFFITSDYRELLARSDIDTVFICTPDFLHEEHALAAIEAGKAVYLEKPMAISIESCDRIIARAMAKGTKLYVGHNMRFFPVMRKMKQLIAEGRIGKVQAIWCRHFIDYGGDAYFRTWHSERRNSHGLLLQKGAHDIDIIHWLAGSYTSRVVGMGKLSVYDRLPRRTPEEPAPPVKFDRAHWPPEATGGYSPKIEVEDHSMLMMQLGNGVQASYAQCHYTPDHHRNYTIIGTEGRIENHGCTSTEERWATVHLWNRRTGYMTEGHEVFRIPHVEGGHGGADPKVIADFLHFLRGGAACGATMTDARMAVATAYQGTESLRNGNIPLDIPSPDFA